MRPELLRLADTLVQRGEPFAIATVVSRRAPSSARPGDAAIVTADGGFHGWIGGSCTRPTVVAEAARALADGEPRLIALSPDADSRPRPGVAAFPMTCRSGGTVEIHIQPVVPAPRLYVFGLSPIARALARLGIAMGYGVAAIDPGAEEKAFPGAERVLSDAAELETPAARPGPASRIYAVVATQGEWDEEAILAALGLVPDYCGVVASSKRFDELREFLEPKLTAAQKPLLGVLKGPAGLDIGARAPEEVAISILAEIVERRPRAPRTEAPAVEASREHDAVDPVCGMTVLAASTKHRTHHRGRDYYFCCSGCWAKFVEHPESFVQVGT